MQHYFVNTKIDNYFLFDKETNHHLNNVMRIKNKEELICVYEEVFYLCEIEVNNKELKAIIKEKLEGLKKVLCKVITKDCLSKLRNAWIFHIFVQRNY